MDNQTFVEQLLNEAANQRVSDVFFKPRDDNTYDIQFKNWELLNYCNVPNRKAEDVINLLKFNANMDISEKRRPQLGAIRKQDYNLRLSSVGDYANRQILVIRILYPLSGSPALYFPNDIPHIVKFLDKSGLIIFSGPTGSGKTSLMYQLLLRLQGKTIFCIEDPVEICVDDFIQIQVNNQADKSYAELLKLSLRQRPDVIVIGEIRDEETAKAALRAGMSGHTVISTLHAQSAVGVVKRLENFGISKLDLENNLLQVCYQRMIRNSNEQMKIISELLSDVRHDKATFNKRLLMLQKEGEIDQKTYCELQRI